MHSFGHLALQVIKMLAYTEKYSNWYFATFIVVSSLQLCCVAVQRQKSFLALNLALTSAVNEVLGGRSIGPAAQLIGWPGLKTESVTESIPDD